MSWVDNVMVSTFGEGNALDKLNAAAVEPCCGQTFSDLTQAKWGGGKYPECDLVGAAFNYAHLYGLLPAIAAIPWKHPHYVQVFIREQEAYIWTVYDMEALKKYSERG